MSWPAKTDLTPQGGAFSRVQNRVARNTKIVFSPQCGGFLQRISEMPSCESRMHPKQAVLGTVDIKDAFLMVDQVKPMVTLLNSKDRVRKNLPGQRLGAKAWYMHFCATLSKDFGFEWCVEQPCLARNEHCCIMVHVDDVMFCDVLRWWSLLGCLPERFEPEVLHQPLAVGKSWHRDPIPEKNVATCSQWFSLASRYMHSQSDSWFWSLFWKGTSAKNSMWQLNPNRGFECQPQLSRCICL